MAVGFMFGSPLIRSFPAQPVPPIIPDATNVTLTVPVFTSTPQFYQWQFDGTNLVGATNSTLTLTNVASSNMGTYSVLMTNSYTNASTTIVLMPALLSTQTPDPSLQAADLMASISTGPNTTGVWFQWGINTNYGQVTPTTFVKSVNALTISNLITSLTPYTVYHCQAVVSNALGIVYGGDVSFTTVPKFVQVGTNSNWSAMVLSG